MTSERYLYQFPLSLYCEKTRWNLDYKRLRYVCQNMMPGLHLPKARWLANQSTLPILRDGKRVVGDSTDIALWLEKTYRQYPLLPDDPEQREEVLSLERIFDELGDHVRRVVWSRVVNGPQVEQIFYGFHGYDDRTRWIGRRTIPVLRMMLRRRFRLQPERVSHSEKMVESAWQKMGVLLQKSSQGYLTGRSFTLADMTAAAMLAPLTGPDASPWSDKRLGMAPGVERDTLRNSVVGEWISDMYRRHRSVEAF